MERLTQTVKSLGDIWLLENGKTKEMVADSNEYKQYFEKLAEYEELEEQGLLIRLPCKVGERLFVIWNANGHWRIVPVDVKEISLGIYMTMKMVQVKVEQISGRGCLFNFYTNDFEKVIFRSIEEAEQKLKELQKEGENNEQIS